MINSLNPFNWMGVGRAIRNEKPDFVIIRFWIPFLGPALGTIARRIWKNGHTKVISLVDNAIPHEKRVGDSAFSRYFMKSCDGFLAMSKSVERDIESFGTKKPIEFSEHPLYTSFGEAIGQSEARKQLALDENGKYLLFFGLIRKYKGLDLLLEALADPRLKERNIQLIIAGEYYEDPEYYTTLIAQNGLADRVKLHTKYIPDSEVKLYFSACDLVTLTYHTATQSGVAAVAMNFDKPSLVTNVGGLSEIIEHGRSGYVVAPDKTIIADSIVDYFDHNRSSSFIEATRIIKKKFSWETMVRAVETIYERTLAGKN